MAWVPTTWPRSLRRSATVLNMGRAWILVAALLAGCATPPSSLRVEKPVVMIKSVRLPLRHWLPWYSRFAEHLWVDFYHADSWRRAEWDNIHHIRLQLMSETQVFHDERWERPAQVHQCFYGEEGARIAQEIVTRCKDYPLVKDYRAWPGPNSNSFLVWLAHEVDMRFVPPPNALGKDFTTWLHAGVTPSGTGLELETLPLGLEVGLREGIELHCLGLTAGIGLWPPALKLPFLPAIPGGWFAPD